MQKRYQRLEFGLLQKQSTFMLLKSLTLRWLYLKNIIFQRFNFSILTEKFRTEWMSEDRQNKRTHFFIQDASLKWNCMRRKFTMPAAWSKCNNTLKWHHKIYFYILKIQNLFREYWKLEMFTSGALNYVLVQH